MDVSKRQCQQLRVLHVNHSDEHGGAELALRRLLIQNVPWEPHLLLPRPAAGVLEERSVFANIAASGVAVSRRGAPVRVGASTRKGWLSTLGFVSSMISQSWAVASSVRSVRPAVVWANSSRSAVYSALATIGRRTPLILHLRDRVEKESLGAMGFMAFTKIALPFAAAVVANSGSTLTSAEKFINPRAKRIVVPSPIGLETLTPAQVVARSAVLDDEDARHIGMLARLDPWKGQHLALLAFSAARKRTTRPLILHLAGAADFGQEAYASRLRAMTEELDLVDHVVFEGRRGDVASFIDGMHLCLQFSTRAEPLGQNVLQYLARGTTVIAADEGGPTEWIDHGRNGYLVPARDVEALADAIADLADDDVRRLEIGRAAVVTPGLRSDAEIASVMGAFVREASKLRKRRGRP